MKRSADLAIVCVTVLMAIYMLRAPAAPDAAVPIEADRDVPRDVPVGAWMTALAAPPLTLAQNDAGLKLPSDDRSALSTSLPPLTGDLINTCIEVAGDLDQKLAAKLSELREKNPQEFARRLLGSRRLLELARLKQRDPDLYKVKLFELETDAKVARLAIEYCRARQKGTQEELADLQGELQQQVMFQVGSTLRSRADYICRLEEEVQRLDAKLQEDLSAFNGLVTARMDHLLDCAARRSKVPPGGLSPEAQRDAPEIPAE